MAHQHAPSHNRHSGTTRGRYGRDYADSRPAARSTNESSTRRQATSDSVDPRRQRETDVQDYRSSRSRRRVYAASEHGDDYSQLRYDHHGIHPRPPSYDRVARSYQAESPEVQRILYNPTLEDAMARLQGRTSPHNRSSVRQPRPMPTQQRPHAHSPDWYYRNSAPLGLSNLRRLNEERGRDYAMDRRSREDERAGPYDAIGYIERPQYVYEERWQQQQNQYDEYGDGSSDETLF